MRKLRKLERALVDGNWYGYAKSTQTFGGVAVGVGLALTTGASIYGTVTQAGIADSQLGLQQQQMGKQNQAFQQLQQLISDPGSFFSSPVYTSAANQGAQAVAKTNAAA